MAHFASPENLADASAAEEARVQAFLAAAGWVQTGTLELTIDGQHSATSYTVPGCAAQVRIAAISLNAEDVGLLRGLAAPGDRVLFLYDRQIWEREPTAGSFIAGKLERIAGVLRLSRETPRAVLGIVAPSNCPVEHLASWALL